VFKGIVPNVWFVPQMGRYLEALSSPARSVWFAFSHDFGIPAHKMYKGKWRILYRRLVKLKDVIK
jgi:hypothetical protein